MALTTLQWLKFGASAAMGIFTGGALYINGVEHHSRRSLDVHAQRQEWDNSFDRAKIFLPSFGTIGAVCSTAIYFLSEEEDKYLWLIGPISFILGGIYTVFVMLPEIEVLKQSGIIEKKGEPWVRAAIDRWNSRHKFRTCVDGAVFLTFLYLSIRS